MPGACAAGPAGMPGGTMTCRCDVGCGLKYHWLWLCSASLCLGSAALQAAAAAAGGAPPSLGEPGRAGRCVGSSAAMCPGFQGPVDLPVEAALNPVAALAFIRRRAYAPAGPFARLWAGPSPTPRDAELVRASWRLAPPRPLGPALASSRGAGQGRQPQPNPLPAPCFKTIS